MAPAKLSKARWVTVAELAEAWSPELKRPREFVERELLLSIINFGRFFEGKGWVEKFPGELPSSSELIDRAHVEIFCRKQGWPLPSWFGKQKEGPSFAGRPSLMNAVIAELKRRAARGETRSTKKEEAQVLAAWARESFPDDQTPTPRTIENQIKELYWQLAPRRANGLGKKNGLGETPRH